MQFYLNLFFVTLFAVATSVVTSCGSGGDGDDQDIVDTSDGTGSRGTPTRTNLSPTPNATATPININNTGCKGSNQLCPNSGFNLPAGTRPSLPPVSPLLPIGDNCSTMLELKTSVGGAHTTRSYLLGRIEPTCLLLGNNAEVLLKISHELTLANSLRCLNAAGEYPILCQVNDLKVFVAPDGVVLIDVLLSPSVPYMLSGKFNVVR